MDNIRKFIGMGWTTPVVRTFAQAALTVLAAAGLNFVDVEVWRTAVVAGGAAVIAYAQAQVRK